MFFPELPSCHQGKKSLPKLSDIATVSMQLNWPANLVLLSFNVLCLIYDVNTKCFIIIIMLSL